MHYKHTQTHTNTHNRVDKLCSEDYFEQWSKLLQVIASPAYHCLPKHTHTYSYTHILRR